MKSTTSSGLNTRALKYRYDSSLDLKHLIWVVLILVVVTFVTGMIGIWIIFRGSHDRQIDTLRAFAQAQAEILNSYLILDELQAEGEDELVKHDHALRGVGGLIHKQEGFLETGEFALAYRENDKVVFVVTNRGNEDHHEIIILDDESQLAEPMRLALEGQEGVFEGEDYEGTPVMAAYLPIPHFDAGLVVKLDQSEFYAPYHRARLITLIIGVVFVALGSWIIWVMGQRNLKNLREREELIRLSFQNSAIGKALVAPDGTWLSANKSLVRMLGYTESELLKTDFQTITYPDDLETDPAYVQAMLRGEINVYHMEKRYFHKSGDIIWSYLSVSLVRDSHGEPLFFISQIQDITERKRIEFENQQLNLQLKEQLALRGQQLDTASGALQGFAYSVSHDLRTPLRAMSGFSQALVDEYGDKLDDTAGDYIMRINRAASNMAELIDSLLRLSRTSFGELNVVTLDLTAMVKRVVENYRSVEPDYDVTVKVAPGLRGQGDLRLIGSVLDNLIGNAWKYTHRVDNPVIEFGSEETESPDKSGKRIHAFYVRDNGVGFDMAYADKLFRPFQRIHNDVDFEGTGVGLASVQTIINRHGGRIWAFGENGKGATFYFTLKQHTA